jgi:hypothetical protein
MPIFASYLLPKGLHCIKQIHPVLEELLAGHQLALYLFAPCVEIHSMVQVLLHLLNNATEDFRLMFLSA